MPKSQPSFIAGHESTGVDLHWHLKSDFKNISEEQCDELVKWMKSNHGKKALKKSCDAYFNKKCKNSGGSDGDRNPQKSE